MQRVAVPPGEGGFGLPARRGRPGRGNRLDVHTPLRRELPRALCTAMALAVSPGALSADLPAIVTLLEGQALLLRGTSRHALAEGVRLQAGDIVEVSDKGVAQVEFTDDAALSLGPGSRFYAAAFPQRGAKPGAAADFYLLKGWMKLTAGKNASPVRVTTPAFGLAAGTATAVAHVGDAAGEVFVEAGELFLAEGFAKATLESPLRVKGGEFYARQGEQRGSIQPRPAPAFVGAMPKPFMDNLPARAAKWKGRDVPPQVLGAAGYGDVELWLKAAPEIRRAVMKPFIPKARDREFRAALVENLRFHPEWDRILFPEKYRPKPPPEPPAPPAASAPALTQ